MNYIDNLLHFYETADSFEAHRKMGVIDPDSICFIEETGQIYVQGSLIGVCKKRFEALEKIILEHDARMKDILGIEGSTVKDGAVNNFADLVKFLDGFTDEDNLKEVIDKIEETVVNQLNAIGKNIEDRIKAVETFVSDYSDQINSTVDLLNNRVSNSEDILNSQGVSIDLLSSNLSSLTRDFNALKSSYDLYKEYVTDRFNIIGNNITTLSSSVSTLQQNFVELSNKFDAVEDKLAVIDSTLERVEDLALNIENIFENTTADFEQFKKEVDNNIKSISDTIGQPNGIAPLDEGAKVPAAYLPSYVDDVLEYDTIEAFPVPGESGKIYVSLDDNRSYRWSGSTYIELSKSLGLGETATTAYPGNKGKKNADDIAAHKADTNNPHNVTKTQLGLDKVSNTSDEDKPVSTVQAAAIKVVQDDLTSHKSNKNNPHEVTKAQVGLGNVDNTADLDKPISNSTQAALDVLTNSLEGHIDDKTNPHNVTKEQLGLGNVENTADKDKPISDAAQNLFDTKVDKIVGKGLSTNDFTNEDKAKLDNSMSNRKLTSEEIENLASKNVGDLVYNTTINKYVYWNGTSWEEQVTKSEFDTEVDALDAVIDTKVDKIAGKSLSANDFTDDYKGILDNPWGETIE